MKILTTIKEKIAVYKGKQKRKQIRRSIRRALKKVFNRKVFVKIIIVLSGLALIASYTLPYILR